MSPEDAKENIEVRKHVFEWEHRNIHGIQN